jgi:hypothetical protein
MITWPVFSTTRDGELSPAPLVHSNDQAKISLKMQVS